MHNYTSWNWTAACRKRSTISSLSLIIIRVLLVFAGTYDSVSWKINPEREMKMYISLHCEIIRCNCILTGNQRLHYSDDYGNCINNQTISSKKWIKWCMTKMWFGKSIFRSWNCFWVIWVRRRKKVIFIA